MNLTINKVEFKTIKERKYAFYFSIVKIKNEWCSFVSHHVCDGMPEAQAKEAFSREHFKEVETLVLQKMKSDSIILN